VTRSLRIGLSPRLMHQVPAELGFRNKKLQYLEQSIAHWVMAHGALAFMLPTLVEHGEVERRAIRVSDYVRELDGLILQGGADVSPTSYGQQPLRPEWGGDRVRDLYEIELFWECMIQGKPVLGICRGCQLINVALGGTLWQDIPSQVEEAGGHHDPEQYDDLTHTIAFEAGASLRRIHGGIDGGRVTSIHHQAIRDLGKDLAVEARSLPDGLIEAIRWRGDGFVLGVQWHPEFHAPAAAGLLSREPLIRAFLDAAAARAASV
jgi:gamma-glutamyl-gamma-aminobutyrate hydrolase PuuD